MVKKVTEYHNQWGNEQKGSLNSRPTGAITFFSKWLCCNLSKSSTREERHSVFYIYIRGLCWYLPVFFARCLCIITCHIAQSVSANRPFYDRVAWTWEIVEKFGSSLWFCNKWYRVCFDLLGLLGYPLTTEKSQSKFLINQHLKTTNNENRPSTFFYLLIAVKPQICCKFQ